MSRSQREPYVSLLSIGRGAMKDWKKKYNRSLRRRPIEDDVSDYKKWYNRYDAPDDGTRHYWDDPKAKRK